MALILNSLNLSDSKFKELENEKLTIKKPWKIDNFNFKISQNRIFSFKSKSSKVSPTNLKPFKYQNLKVSIFKQSNFIYP